jgi:SpoVK/Ycf46/Vps4 family AAA+-type ATPase
MTNPPTPYPWVAFYQELSRALLAYKSRQEELLQMLQRADVKIGHDGGETLTVIDPLTFLSLINKHSSSAKLTQILTQVRVEMGVSTPVPEHFLGLPTSDPRNAWMFPSREWRKPEDISTLWNLSWEAVNGQLQPQTFARALQIDMVGLSKLTTGLFWVNAERYLALNSKNVAYLADLGFPDAANVTTLEAYQATLDRTSTFSASFAELSHRAWLSRQPVTPPATFPFDDLRSMTREYRARIDELEAEGQIKEAQRVFQDGQSALHQRFAPMLYATVRQRSFQSLHTDETTRYTGGKYLYVKTGFRLTTTPEGEGLWFGQMYLGANREEGNGFLRAELGLAHGKDPEGRDSFRRALQRPEIREAFLKVILDVAALPRAPLISMNLKGWKGQELEVHPDWAQTLGQALQDYALAVGTSRMLTLNIRLNEGELSSVDYPDLMAETLAYLDDVATFITGAVAGQRPALVPVGTTPAKVVPAPTWPLNVILYGPPGTGKTYAVTELALQRLNPEFLDVERSRGELQERLAVLQREGRAVFTTFHQSFSYEDFIEGIKPVSAGLDSGDAAGSVAYELSSGVLKRLAERAATPPLAPEFSDLNPLGSVWKISLDWAGGESATREHCLDHGEARLGYAHVGPFHEAADISGAPKAFFQGMQPGDLLLVSGSNTSVRAAGIVTGEYQYEEQVPPGVKPEYRNVRKVTWIARDLNVPFKEKLGRNFSQKSLYSLDLTVPEVLEYLRAQGALPQAGGATAPLPHVLIIDEINRGNVSKVFGELITLLELSKRQGREEATTVELPYSKRPFSLPDNLYVIGTMNTADQSLARLDSALRRRFDFVEMLPRPELLHVTTDGIDLRKLLYAVNRRITLLQGRDSTLGHAYLLGLNAQSTVTDVARIFRQRVLPLLEEYFFDDWRRIRVVLGDEAKPSHEQLIVREDAGAWLEGWDAPAATYSVQEAALTRVGAYTGIYAGNFTFPFEPVQDPQP